VKIKEEEEWEKVVDIGTNKPLERKTDEGNK
jgi:hypothetical protein